MLTGKQIRAARMLIEWDAEDLAEKSGLNRETIFNIERGSVQARSTTLEKIVRAFSEYGIEFLEDQGVRFRPEGTDILNGSAGLEVFFDQVYSFLSTRGGLVCVSGVDEAQFAAHHGAALAAAHVQRMNKLVEQRGGIEFRVLLREGDTNFMATSYCHYRWQAADNFVATPFYVFGDSLALITFQAKPAPKIMVIRSEAFADAYRKQFDVAWKIAKDPHHRKS
jgi:transcriptional regulator with XRE-family HTH domain